MLGNTPADLAVLIDANSDSSIAQSYQKLLVPYTANNHDDLSVEIALRMLWNDRNRQLELIRIISPETKDGELDSLLENL
jgi:hypothetical protein